MGALICALLIPAAIAQSEGKQARRLVEHLRAESIEDRREAAQRLLELGAGALPELGKATSDKDADVAGRAKDLIHSIRQSVATTAVLPGGGPFRLFVSSYGRFVVACGPKRVLVFEADTLKPVRTLDFVVRSVGFSQDDQEMILAGECLVRIALKDWKETLRLPLADDTAKLADDAWITSGEEVYYRTGQRGLWSAKLDAKQLLTKEVGIQTLLDVEKPEVTGFLGKCGDWILLSLTPGKRLAVCNGRKAYQLRSKETEVLSAGMISDRVVFVCGYQITAYDPVTWKPAGIWKRESEVLGAAFDSGSQRIFLSDGNRLRVLSLSEPEKERVYEPVKILPSAFVIDSNARLLYGISGNREVTLHCWHLGN